MKREELSYNTKRRIGESLKELMARKSLRKITIQEIADGCGVNRYTFYYHFKDIYDLLSWMFQEEALSQIQVSENCLTWQDGFRVFLRTTRENKAVYKCALEGLGQELLRNMFYQEVSPLMRCYLSDAVGTRQVSEEYQRFLSDFYAVALIGTVVEWLRRDCDAPEDRVLAYIRTVLDRQMLEDTFSAAEREGL